MFIIKFHILRIPEFIKSSFKAINCILAVLVACVWLASEMAGKTESKATVLVTRI